MAQVVLMDKAIESRVLKMPIIDREDPSKKFSEKEEKHMREMGNYEFLNREEAGQLIKFPYGQTKNSHTFTFLHGGQYRLPRFIARWVESCSKPIWKWKPDGNGGLEKTLVSRDPRFQMREMY